MKELLENYPKATKVVKNYYLEKLLQSLEGRGLPDEFKDHVRQQGITNETLAALLEDGPRNLFDVFDTQQIYIETHALIGAEEIAFACMILNHFDIIFDGKSKAFPTRLEAEQFIIAEAFKLLDAQLE